MKYTDQNYAMCLDVKHLLDMIEDDVDAVIHAIIRFSPGTDFDAGAQLERLEPDIDRLNEVIGLLEYMKGRDRIAA